jgi:hypothetical protein
MEQVFQNLNFKNGEVQSSLSLNATYRKNINKMIRQKNERFGKKIGRIEIIHDQCQSLARDLK